MEIDLSVIIVNYNVKFYLEQCLVSVLEASKNLNVEIFVVDNESTDGSVSYISERFPTVHLIANDENVGFGRANNMAVTAAKGKYVLFLNPDTVVPEDCFELCIRYMDEHPDCAALGPKLIDGIGEYLPESKRGFPSLSVAFFKITGLNRLFPKSAKINGYYMGHLPENEIHTVDVLVGCFMFMRKAFLDEHGAFDPDYFMYGEDIDLSYRVIQAGYQNVYFPETTVIHYKGESTQKGSLNYVKMFYEAMMIFSQKHLSKSQSWMYDMFLSLAIILKGTMSIIVSKLKGIKLYLIDFLITLGSLFLVKNIWNTYVKVEINYDPKLTSIAFLVYAFIWVLILYFNGVYDRPYKRYRIWRGTIAGAIVILAVYSLLPIEYRFSRGITLFGTSLAGVLMLLYRRLFTWMDIPGFDFAENEKKGLLVVGDSEDTTFIFENFNPEFMRLDIKGTISPTPADGYGYLGHISDLRSIASSLYVHEIIFTHSTELSFKEIIDWFQKLHGDYEFKIFREQSSTIIGSNSKNTAGDLYSLDPTYNIGRASARRNKRVLDLMISTVVIFCSPILLFTKHRSRILSKILQVLWGKMTWVGYNSSSIDNLPDIKAPVIDITRKAGNNQRLADKIKSEYALHYHPYEDLKYLNAYFFN